MLICKVADDEASPLVTKLRLVMPCGGKLYFPRRGCLRGGAGCAHARGHPFPRDQAPAWSRTCLGNSASPGRQQKRARARSFPATKQSFADKGVPKLELGHESGSGRFFAHAKTARGRVLECGGKRQRHAALGNAPRVRSRPHPAPADIPKAVSRCRLPPHSKVAARGSLRAAWRGRYVSAHDSLCGVGTFFCDHARRKGVKLTRPALGVTL